LDPILILQANKIEEQLMKLNNTTSAAAAVFVISTLSACGGSGSGMYNSPDSIKLGGPLTQAAVASDAPTDTGTVCDS